MNDLVYGTAVHSEQHPIDDAADEAGAEHRDLDGRDLDDIEGLWTVMLTRAGTCDTPYKRQSVQSVHSCQRRLAALGQSERA
jgi:hypothetical protein